ncbi:hypothetical protein [Pantanalinema sp. GBBB05]
MDGKFDAIDGKFSQSMEQYALSPTRLVTKTEQDSHKMRDRLP